LTGWPRCSWLRDEPKINNTSQKGREAKGGGEMGWDGMWKHPYFLNESREYYEESDKRNVQEYLKRLHKESEKSPQKK